MGAFRVRDEQRKGNQRADSTDGDDGAEDGGWDESDRNEGEVEDANDGWLDGWSDDEPDSGQTADDDSWFGEGESEPVDPKGSSGVFDSWKHGLEIGTLRSAADRVPGGTQRERPMIGTNSSNDPMVRPTRRLRPVYGTIYG